MKKITAAAILALILAVSLIVDVSDDDDCENCDTAINAIKASVTHPAPFRYVVPSRAFGALPV